MKITETRSLVAPLVTLVTRCECAGEGIEITFGGVYTIAMGRKEWHELCDRVDGIFGMEDTW